LEPSCVRRRARSLGYFLTTPTHTLTLPTYI